MGNTVLQNKHVLILFLSEAGVFVLLSIAFFWSMVLLVRWDFSKHTKRQYMLERKAWLISTIVSFVTIVKFFLLPYFIFTIDYLSKVVPGAMCSAGVISFNVYGMPLLYLKLFTLFGGSFWLTLNNEDLKEGDYPWLRAKLFVFVFLYFVMGVELYMQYRFFLAIDIYKVINCCSTLYGLLEGMNPLPFGLEQTTLAAVFYLLFLLSISAYKSKNHLILFLSYLLFGVIGYYSVLYIFGPYIYEQPNHNCPFCMLQKEYYYVGYFVWGLFLSALFSGLSGLVVEYALAKPKQKLLRTSLWLLTFFVVLCSAYVVLYYYHNGVLLQSSGASESMGGMIM